MGAVKNHYWNEINGTAEEAGFEFYESDTRKLVSEIQEVAIRSAVANADQMTIAEVMKAVREELEKR